jgi:D-amino-acid dehydrogenase
MMDNLRFGGTMEIVGRDKSITPAKVQALKKSVTRYFPEYSLEDLKDPDIWVGLRPCSPDGLPYIGEIEGYKNCFVSTGHAMMGMSLSFAAGELVTQLITEGKAELSHRLIGPDRYMRT